MARATSAGPAAGDRLASIDAYRGFVMLAMVSAGMGLAHLANHPTWGWLAHQFEHVRWEGCVFWDLIQPSFMFLVGASMPFSYAARQGRGQSWPRQFLHALKRAGLLILIGIFLDSYAEGRIYVQFIRVLQQIALGYLVAFLVLPLGPWVQGITGGFLLAGHTAAYLIYARAVGVDPWQAGTNFGVWLDRLLHLPLSRGNYVTFNAVSSAGTILLGVLCGELLRSGAPPGRKVAVLLGAGLGLLGAGWLLSGGGGWVPVEFEPLVPMVKKLWTASFALFAAGWTFLMMAGFHLIVDVLGWRTWSVPLAVVGMNSIAMYVAAGVFRPNAVRAVSLFFPNVPPAVQPLWLPVVKAVLVLGVFWSFCFWLYRHRIFFKV